MNDRLSEQIKKLAEKIFPSNEQLKKRLEENCASFFHGADHLTPEQFKERFDQFIKKVEEDNIKFFGKNPTTLKEFVNCAISKIPIKFKVKARGEQLLEELIKKRRSEYDEETKRRQARVDVMKEELAYAKSVVQSDGPKQGKKKMTQLEVEQFVRKLRVSYENDLEINFQIPGKTAVAYSHAVMGFRKSTDKGWMDFRSILEYADDPTYDLGRAHGRAYRDKAKRQRKLGYDAGQKRLKFMNEKILAFLSKEYGIQIPKAYKIYEHLKNDGPGIYRFKFCVEKRAGYGSEISPEEENEQD